MNELNEIQYEVCRSKQKNAFTCLVYPGGGHTQHVRHNPPWQLRPWVVTDEGRLSKLGYELHCKKCERNEPV